MKIKLLVTLILLSGFAFGQKKENVVSVRAANTQAVFLGKVSPKLNSFKKTSLSERNKKKQDKQMPPNFIGRGKSKSILPELEHQGVDPLRQLKLSQNANTIIEPLVNTDGLFNSFGSPHDPTGSIGTNHYVQAINATEIGIFDKSGNKITEFAANDLWEPLGESSLGDPIVLFDHETNQWIITEFADPALLLIAVSETDDPTGDYSVYSFATPNFPDYPKYAIWSDYVIVTTNEVGPGSLHQYFIDRSALMAGEADVTIQRVEIVGNTSTEAGFYVTTPVHWNGSVGPVDDKPIAVKINDSSWGEVSADALEIFSFDIDLNDPSNTVVEKLTLETTPFDSYPCDNESGGFACLSQGGEGSGGLDAIPEVVMNIPHYRNFETHESIVLNFITDVTNGENLSGIRWMELRRTAGNDWSIYQEGTFAPDDGLHRYMGSIGMDEKGNIGMAYNVSSASEFAGIRFTGRFASDPLGQMTVEEYVAVTGTNFINTDRFGDYPHITVDPLDGQTFWYTAEYGGNGVDNSKTRLLAFQLEKKDNDIAVSGINSPSTGANLTASEQVVATIINNGNLSATGFDIILSLDGSEIETFTYSETLNSGASYEHTFSNAIDLSTVGEYNITVNVSYTGDESSGNDTRTKEVSNLAQLDGLVILNAESSSCNENLEGIIQLVNNGAEVITSAEIELFVNGTSTSTISFSGSLSTGEEAIIETQFDGLINGSNNLSVSILMINGETDAITSNNTSNTTVNYSDDLMTVEVRITTDDYPDETRWGIADENDDILIVRGPFTEQNTTITESICLTDESCYTFIIVDSFGDGIENGSFSVTDAFGEVVVSGTGGFGEAAEEEFCLEAADACKLTVDVEALNVENGSNGSIIISASGGINLQYSIDGGLTFQDESIFNDLTDGSYDVVVKTTEECKYEETVIISKVLGIEDNMLSISPNPTKGLFQIRLISDSGKNEFLEAELMDIKGRIIQTRKFSRYDNEFVGTVSLVAYPKGVYILRLSNSTESIVTRVIKE